MMPVSGLFQVGRAPVAQVRTLTLTLARRAAGRSTGGAEPSRAQRAAAPATSAVYHLGVGARIGLRAKKVRVHL